MMFPRHVGPTTGLEILIKFSLLSEKKNHLSAVMANGSYTQKKENAEWQTHHEFLTLKTLFIPFIGF